TGGRGSGARGHQADELSARDLDTSRARLALDRGDDVVQRRGLPVLDVHAHLRATAGGQVEPERAHAGKAAAALAHGSRDLARLLEMRAREVDVEGDQRTARPDDRSSRRRVESPRAEVRRELARVDALLQLSRATAAEERGSAAAAHLAVEEHRQTELVADTPAELERGRLRTLHVGRPDRH